MNLPPGSAVQFTPFGLTALGDASGVPVGEYAPGVAPQTATPAQSVEEPQPKHRLEYEISIAPKSKTKTGATLKPADVLKLARARVREIKAELRRHAALKKELTQLENMLSAAKPLAPVRALDSARRAG